MTDGEGLDGGVAVVNRVAVSAVGVEGQRTIRAGEGGTQGARSADAFGGSGPDGGHGEGRGGSVDIRVVGQDIAGGVAAGSAIGGATSLDGGAGVVDSDRGLIGFAKQQVPDQGNGVRAVRIQGGRFCQVEIGTGQVFIIRIIPIIDV